MPPVSANGIDIWYEVLGAQSRATPLVMTHGFAGPSKIWRPEIEVLAEKRPLVLYDVRGHDRTTVPDDESEYSMPIFAADLAALLRAIGIDRAHIGGESMGGMATAQFAVNYPEMCASVILGDTTCGNGVSEGPAGEWERQMQRGIGALRHMVGKYGLKETLLKEWEWKQQNDRHLDVSPYTLEDDLARIELMTPEGHMGAAHAILTRPDLTDRIPGIAVPTLVIVGEWDDFLPCAERDHWLTPDSRLVVRAECGHGTRWRLDTFLSEVEAFLDDVDAGRPVAGERRV
jgi:pimeloyl-ACP methyl ester carboxylesterase